MGVPGSFVYFMPPKLLKRKRHNLSLSLSLPHSIMTRLCTTLLITLSLFEAIAWLLDPLGVHTALNDGELMPLDKRVMAAVANSMTPLGLALSLSFRKGLLSSLFWSLMLLFCTMQTAFWWIPYLFGDIAGMETMINEHKSQLENIHTLLPQIDNHLLPDTEHTLLYPLSLYTMYISTRTLLRDGIVGKSLLSRVFLFLLSSTVSFIPLSLSDPTSSAPYQLAPIGSSLLAFSFTLFVSYLLYIKNGGGSPSRLKKE